MTPTGAAARTLTLALLAGLVCAACSVGPKYDRPAIEVPATFKSTTAESTQPTTRLARDWWRLFGDPVLSDLEDRAVQANTDVRAAVARVAQARAAARVTASNFYPLINFGPSITESRGSVNRGGTSVTTGGGGGSTTAPAGGGTTTGGTGVAISSGGRRVTSVQVPFDLSYEVDIWGRVRQLYEASLAGARASADDYEVVLQTVEGDVAQNYFNLRSLDAQSAILGQTVESYRREIELVQQQLKAGLVSPIDLAQAQTLLNSTIAQETDIRRQRADVEHALAILVGRPPAAVSLEVKPLDLVPPAVPPGLPADLLRRRPDVAEAEQNLIAANADVAVAIANFYPALRLTGSAGFESADLRHALDWPSRFWSIGPSLTVPLFTGGQLNAQLQQAQARYGEQVATYQGRVLGAFRDVEDALTDLHLRADAAGAQDEAVKSAREYLRLAEIQYKRGLANYLVVIDAERTLLQNELSAAQILNQRMVSTVLLIKALGGGWDVQDLPIATTQPAGPR